jgi:hypothetical protein
VFGYPMLDGPACETRIESLGDGRYLAVRPDEHPAHPRPTINVDGEQVRWAPHLVECAPSSVDGHIICAEDILGTRGELFGEDIVAVTRSVSLPRTTLPIQYATAAVSPRRCRERFFAWELAHLPAPKSPPFVTTAWSLAAPESPFNVVGEHVELAPLHFRVEEDAISLGRILAGGRASAVVCPAPTTPSVLIDSRIPSRLAQRLATVFSRAVTERGLPIAACTRVTMAFAPAR